MTLPFAEQQEPNVAMGILYGVAAGIVGGGILWAIAFFAHIQFIYGSLGIGALIAFAVLEGIRIPGKSAALISGVIALLTVLMSEYFVVRSLVVQEVSKSGDGGSIPLWLGFTAATRLIKAGIQDNPITLGFWGITIVVAAAKGFGGGNRHNRVVRRPDVPWTPVGPPSVPDPAGLSVPPPPLPAPSAPFSPPPPPVP